jgi:hypothetical protein
MSEKYKDKKEEINYNILIQTHAGLMLAVDNGSAATQ